MPMTGQSKLVRRAKTPPKPTCIALHPPKSPFKGGLLDACAVGRAYPVPAPKRLREGGRAGGIVRASGSRVRSPSHMTPNESPFEGGGAKRRGMWGRAMAAVLLLLFSLHNASATLVWEELPPLPVGIGGHAFGMIGDTLVVAGGAFNSRTGGSSEEVHILRPGADAWQTVGELPAPRTGGVTVFTDDAVYIAGGDALGTVIRLRLQGDELVIDSPLPPLPMPVIGPCGGLIGSTLIVLGGRVIGPDGRGSYLAKGWSIDIDSGSPEWTPIAPLPDIEPITAVSVVQGGELYLIGGYQLAIDPTRGQRNALYRYHPERGWSTQPADQSPGMIMGACAVGSSHIVVLEGQMGAIWRLQQEGRDVPRHDEHDYQDYAIVGAYHTTTDSWATLGYHPSLSVFSVGMISDGRDVYIAGGVGWGVNHRQVYRGTHTRTATGFGIIDYATLVIYLAALIGMGLYFSRREKNTEGFFLGGRRMPWWAVGISIFGTSLSAITYLAIPARAYATDWVWAFANMGILFVAPFIVAFYIPRFRELPITTAYEFLENRFNLPVRIYGSLCFMAFQICRVSIVMCLPAIALSTATGMDVYLCIIAMGVLATIYTVLGGIEAVIWTDVLQAIVLVTGAVVALVLIVWHVDGGAAAIIADARSMDKLHAVNWSWDWTIPALWVVLLGNAMSNLYPATADQTVVQRYLSTADVKTARRAVWTNALLTIPITVLFFSLGTALWAFYRQHPEQLDPALQNDAILPLFVVQQFPIGLKGILIAGVFAAAMSSLDSSMNSVASVLVTDYYRRFVKGVSDRKALLVAKVITLLFGLLGTGTAMMAARLEAVSLWDPFLMVLNWVGGGLSGVMALAVFTKRANGVGAFCGAIASIGVIIFVQRYTNIHFFLHGGAGFVAAFVIGYGVSLLVPTRTGTPPDEGV